MQGGLAHQPDDLAENFGDFLGMALGGRLVEDGGAISKTAFEFGTVTELPLIDSTNVLFLFLIPRRSCAIHNRMPRIARIVVPGVAHHVTQRGNRRQQTFFGAADYAMYLDRIAEGCHAAGVEVLAWCLMPNHAHFVLVPQTTDGLTAAMSSAHQRYTWSINRRNGWSGHLWQSRFHSCPTDDAHLVAAIRYVELNPVRANLAAAPEAWPWSSVRGRVSGKGDQLVQDSRPPTLEHVDDWLTFLAEGMSEEEIERIRQRQTRGRPADDPAFLARLERHTGRDLQVRRPGPRG